MKMHFEGNFIFLLVALFVGNISCVDVPQSDRIHREGGTLYIYPKDNSYVGIYIGGALAVAGLALVVYGKIQNDKAMRDGRLNESCENYYWWGGMLGGLGLIVLGISCYKKNKNQKPLATLTDQEISSDDKKILWRELGDIQNDPKTIFYTVPTCKRCTTLHSDGKTSWTDIPTTETRKYTVKEITLVSRRLAYAFSCDRDDNQIVIPVAELPISEKEFIALVKDYKRMYGAR